MLDASIENLKEKNLRIDHLLIKNIDVKGVLRIPKRN